MHRRNGSAPLQPGPLQLSLIGDKLIAGAAVRLKTMALGEGNALQPVRLVLLVLTGSREGENDFLEFPSIEEAIAYGRELFGEPRFQVDGIEDSKGRPLIAYDHLHELCRTPPAMRERRYG